MTPEQRKAMDAQSAEFDAMQKLAEAWRSLTLTAVVDDDYPRVRHHYESALGVFLKACKANGRNVNVG